MKPEAYEEMHRFEATHGWFVGMRQITAGLLSSILNRGDQLLILDAGCGTGANLSFLRQYGSVLGFDLSALALRYARQEHADRLARANIQALPYPDSTFDVVTSFDVVYHSAVTDDARAFKELARVAKLGGYVLIREPAMPSLRGSHDEMVSGARRYTASTLRARLEDAGLTINRITHANSLLMPAVFAWRKLNSRAGNHSDELPTDVSRSAGLTGELLRLALSAEASWIEKGHSFGSGVSLFVLAQKSS